MSTQLLIPAREACPSCRYRLRGETTTPIPFARRQAVMDIRCGGGNIRAAPPRQICRAGVELCLASWCEAFCAAERSYPEQSPEWYDGVEIAVASQQGQT